MRLLGLIAASETFGRARVACLHLNAERMMVTSQVFKLVDRFERAVRRASEIRRRVNRLTPAGRPPGEIINCLYRRIF